ncbi:MAG TPA: histidine--tRNA ligase [Thermoanaerobaculia bacterium]|nr:histidine--tRNA ligase [Thermoanaerobaculia bacterium]
MKGAVEPRLSRGLRDLLSEPMLARQQMIDTIRGVYENYGFVPLGTPAIEFLDVLKGTAGQETQQAIFTVQNPEREALGLRFDLTVPLARVVAQYPELPRPYRRYQVSPVWRADKPDRGRYREFIQFDLDSVGVASELADTEIIAGMCDTLAALRAQPFRVRYSSRGILNLLLAAAAVPEGGGADVLRVLDKLEKVGIDKVKRELTTGYKDESGDPIRGLGMAAEQVATIERFLDIRADARQEVIARLREFFSGRAEAAAEIDLVERISRQLAALGYGDEQVTLDLSIARGLAYYTGPVYEAVLLDAPQYGSVFSGGRYDDLVMRFLGEKVPATGASLGVDRLLAALLHLGKAGGKKATAQVLVARIDPSLEEECLAMTWELRRAGIPAELYLGGEKGVGRQIKYADLTGVPIVLLYGSTEKERGIVTLKDMEVGRELAKKVDARNEWLAQRPGQRAVPRGELIATVKEMVGAAAATAATAAP